MNNQQAIVDQIIQNLTFEVEAVPKKKSVHTTSMSQSTPMNVKIKVRKKDGINMQQEVSAIADDTLRTAQKVRLVNSDRTFMTFDVFMEAEFEKRPSRKLRKHIFDMLRPGICLGAVDDDEHPYMPSTSYSANIAEPRVEIKSDGTLKQTFTLSKNAYQAYCVSALPEARKWLFGNCKPGGCLDPPFSEEKYAYKPSTRLGPEREEEEELLEAGEVEFDVYSNKKPITLHDEETQSNGRRSSNFDSGLLKRKRKSSDKSTNTKLPDKTDSIVDIYLGYSATNSVSTHSNPIITYPPKRKSDPRISDDKTVMSRGPSEDKPRKSFNDHSEPYFVPPKGVQRLKEKVSLDSNAQPKHRSSDTARDLLKESFRTPVPVPIPIPVLIPTISSKQKPEVIATNDHIIKKDSIPDQKPHDQDLKDQGQQDQELRDQGLQDQDLKDQGQQAQDLRDQGLQDQDLKDQGQQDEDLRDQGLQDQYLKAQGQQDQDLRDQGLQDQDLKDQRLQDQCLKDQGLQDQELQDLKLQDQDLLHQLLLDQELQGTINLKDTEITPRLLRTKSTNGDTDDNPVESTNIASLVTSNVKEPNAPFEIDDQNLNEKKLLPLKVKESENNVEDIANKKKNTDFFNIPVPVPVPFPLHLSDPNRADSVDSKTKNDNVDDDMKLTQPRKSYETKTTPTAKDTPFEGLKDMQQNKEPGFGANESSAKATPNLEHSYIETDAIPEIYLRTRGGFSDQDSDPEMPVTLDAKRDSVEKKITSGVIKPAKQSDIKDKATTPIIYIEEDVKQDFEGEKIIDGIEKPPNQKDIEDKATTAITYTEDDIKRDPDGENITGEIENPVKLNEILDNSTIPSTYIEKDTKRYSKEGTITGRIIKSAEQKDIKDKVTIPTTYSEEDIKRDSKRESITDEIENAVKLNEILDKSTIPSTYIEEYTKRYSKEVTITDRIIKPAEQKDIKDKVTIPTTYSEEDIKRDSKAESITDEIENTAKQKHIQDKPATATEYAEDSPGVIGMPDSDTHQIKGTTKKDERKDSQSISLSKLPILQKNISLLSQSKTSAAVIYRTKRDDTPDKHLDDIRHGDTDLGIYKDEQRSSLRSEPEYETDSGDGETSNPYRDKEYVSKTTKTNNDDKMDSYIESQTRYTNDESMNIIATPVTIANTEDNSIFETVKDVYTEPSFVSKPMESNNVPFIKQILSKYKKFDDDDEDAHSIGTKSVMHETDGFVPSVSAKKHAEITPSPDKRVTLPEDTAISYVQSVSTLKSAMKKDTISIDFGFHSYLNDKNERIVQTIDSANAPKRLPSDLITVIKAQIRISSNEIRVPVDSEHDMSIQIKKTNANQRVSISESGLVNVIDTAKKQIFPEQCSDVETRSFKAIAVGRKDIIHGSDAMAHRFLDYYEQELVPLQLIIKNLREEIDFLATQQSIFKDKLYCPNKSKLPRLVHSNKKCFGCIRK